MFESKGLGDYIKRLLLLRSGIELPDKTEGLRPLNWFEAMLGRRPVYYESWFIASEIIDCLLSKVANWEVLRIDFLRIDTDSRRTPRPIYA